MLDEPATLASLTAFFFGLFLMACGMGVFLIGFSLIWEVIK